MEWNEKTKTLTISWVDMEHISDDYLLENLKWEMDTHGLDNVKIEDIKHIIVNTADKIVIGCSKCMGKREATVFVKSKVQDVNTALCFECWTKMKECK